MAADRNRWHIKAECKAGSSGLFYLKGKPMQATGRTAAEMRDAKLKRDNVLRMCEKFGTCLGRTWIAEYWVCDGQVWCIGDQRALLCLEYFEFCNKVRHGEIKGYVAAQ